MYLYYTVFPVCFILHLRAISKYKPPGLVFGGAIYRTAFRVTSLRGLYMERLIFGSLQYLVFKILRLFKTCNTESRIFF